MGQPEFARSARAGPAAVACQPALHGGHPDWACRPAALVTTAAVPPWAWALVGLVVGIPFCAQLNCYIEKKREECAKRDEVDANV